MGKLYDDCNRVQQFIDQQGLDVFRTRGALAMKCGFLITIVKPTDADDQQKISALRDAALDVLGLTL